MKLLHKSYKRAKQRNSELFYELKGQFILKLYHNISTSGPIDSVANSKSGDLSSHPASWSFSGSLLSHNFLSYSSLYCQYIKGQKRVWSCKFIWSASPQWYKFYNCCFFHNAWINLKSPPCIIATLSCWARMWETAHSLAVVIKVDYSSVHCGSVRFTGNDKEGFWSYYYPVTTPQWLHPAALLACSPASLIRLQRWSNWLLITAVFRPTGVLSSCTKEGERINQRKPRRIKHSNGFVA